MKINFTIIQYWYQNKRQKINQEYHLLKTMNHKIWSAIQTKILTNAKKPSQLAKHNFFQNTWHKTKDRENI